MFKIKENLHEYLKVRSISRLEQCAQLDEMYVGVDIILSWHYLELTLSWVDIILSWHYHKLDEMCVRVDIIFALVWFPNLDESGLGNPTKMHCHYCDFHPSRLITTFIQVGWHENEVETTACQELAANPGFPNVIFDPYYRKHSLERLNLDFSC